MTTAFGLINKKTNKNIVQQQKKYLSVMFSEFMLSRLVRQKSTAFFHSSMNDK